MTQLYEGMFLLDNQAVRADWAQAKAAVTDALAKHGGVVRSARRWDERRLAYPIRGRKRATYLLTYFEQEGAATQGLRRDLDIEERVLRYLILATQAIPEGELEKSQAELEAGFSVPPPPADDEPGAPVEEARAEGPEGPQEGGSVEEEVALEESVDEPVDEDESSEKEVD